MAKRSELSSRSSPIVIVVGTLRETEREAVQTSLSQLLDPSRGEPRGPSTSRSIGDPLTRFLSECTERVSDQERIQSSHLHQACCSWARLNGEDEWTATALGLELKRRGFKSLHSNVNYWLGLRLNVRADYAKPR
jgi:hypothetical protein